VIRREFLQTLSAGALAALPLPRLPLMEDKIRSIGIQLYTLRDVLKQDFEGTIAALARIGYKELEFAGLYDRKATDIRAMLDHHGLRAPSGHYGIPDITDNIGPTIETAHTLGHRYVVVPWLPEELRNANGYGQLAQTFNQAGEKLRAAGLTLGYHNHWFEFDPLDSMADLPEEYRKTGYDLLLDQTDPGVVVMELDLFWIRKGHRDPLTYFKQYPGRFHLVHVKDMAADGAMVDVGAGAIDWKEIFRQAPTAGIQHCFIEHDEAKDPLAFAKTSFDYLKRLRY